MLNVIDPSHEATVAGVQPATREARWPEVGGSNINGKEGTIGFFKYLGDLLKSELGVARVDVHVRVITAHLPMAHHGADTGVRLSILRLG